ncbi:MAG: glycosyltransferase, partial [Cycloclasticus sp.]
LHNKLLSKLQQISENILQWDQDVLNSFFNGKYLELEEKFNFKASSKITNSYKNKLVFIHFIGSHKPWLTSGVFQKDSNFYQAMQLGMLETVGVGWQKADEYVEKIKAVTAEQVRNAAKKYLNEDHLTVVHMMSQGGLDEN